VADEQHSKIGSLLLICSIG